MWLFRSKDAGRFSWCSTAEEVTHGIDSTGLTAIVTGSSSGIGAETARVLALRGVHVIMAVNILDEGKQVRREILREIPTAKIDVMELDLSSMASVRNFAAQYKSSNYPLNILINNAGVFATPFMLSKDNIELQFAINYLGHFLLTHLVIDNMKETARKSGKEGRIVNVTSESHRHGYPQGIRFDELNNPSGYNRWSAYCQSKLAVILHAKQLAKLLQVEGIGITANFVHPGCVSTKICSNVSLLKGIAAQLFLKFIGRVFIKIFLIKSAAQGAATTCYVALHPQVNGVNGEYFSDCNLAKPSAQAEDAALAKKLWDFSIDLITQ